MRCRFIIHSRSEAATGDTQSLQDALSSAQAIDQKSAEDSGHYSRLVSIDFCARIGVRYRRSIMKKFFLWVAAFLAIVLAMFAQSQSPSRARAHAAHPK